MKIHKSKRLKRGRVFVAPGFKNRWRRYRVYGIPPTSAALEYSEFVRWMNSYITDQYKRMGLPLAVVSGRSSYSSIYAS